MCVTCRYKSPTTEELQMSNDFKIKVGTSQTAERISENSWKEMVKAGRPLIIILVIGNISGRIY